MTIPAFVPPDSFFLSLPNASGADAVGRGHGRGLLPGSIPPGSPVVFSPTSPVVFAPTSPAIVVVGMLPPSPGMSVVPTSLGSKSDVQVWIPAELDSALLFNFAHSSHENPAMSHVLHAELHPSPRVQPESKHRGLHIAVGDEQLMEPESTHFRISGQQ